MEYRLEINDQVYELPKFNLGMKKKIDQINKDSKNDNISLEKRVTAIHNFLKETLGEEAVNVICEGDSIETVDLQAINITYLSIVKAYDKPMEEFNSKKLEDVLNNDALARMDKLGKTVASIQSMPLAKK